MRRETITYEQNHWVMELHTEKEIRNTVPFLNLIWDIIGAKWYTTLG